LILEEQVEDRARFTHCVFRLIWPAADPHPLNARRHARGKKLTIFKAKLSNFPLEIFLSRSEDQAHQPRRLE